MQDNPTNFHEQESFHIRPKSPINHECGLHHEFHAWILDREIAIHV